MNVSHKLGAMKTITIGWLLVVGFLLGCRANVPLSADQVKATQPLQPEASSGKRSASVEVLAQKFALATANPLATDAGYQILKAGGAAIDAAVTIQMVLNLVEPQSSGIGGGSFILHFNGKEVEAYDGRETAPKLANQDLFLRTDGTPMSFYEAVVGGRSVGVPGNLKVLEMVHQKYGKLPWKSLFQLPIELAEKGFRVSPRLHTLIKNDPYLKSSPTASKYFYQTDAQPWPVGYVLKNPELAQVFRNIADQGARGFYQGWVAENLLRTVAEHPTNPGLMTLDDLKGYQAIQRAPLCFDYPTSVTVYAVCGFPPPSSGTLAIGQIMGIMRLLGQTHIEFDNEHFLANWLHFYFQSANLAFADRGLYVADPSFVSAPNHDWASLLSEDYLLQRAKLVDHYKNPGHMPPGNPTKSIVSLGYMPEQDEFGTSHISIIDGFGQAISMTTTLEDAFGSRQMVDGYLLNNELTDFSFLPKSSDGRWIANRVEAGKRPRSSMSPILVFDKSNQKLEMSVGSPGGSLIIHFVAKTLLASLNHRLDPQKAINLPNFAANNGVTLLENCSLSN
ncbi:MAG: gamma-glutamyltransferase family protein, partial [Gammaproteobacteria bacterium]|nr:gamma-glutamyltransferase family protein [Gammaproteobacteria bacterium]